MHPIASDTCNANNAGDGKEIMQGMGRSVNLFAESKEDKTSAPTHFRDFHGNRCVLNNSNAFNSPFKQRTIIILSKNLREGLLEIYLRSDFLKIFFYPPLPVFERLLWFPCSIAFRGVSKRENKIK